MVARYWLGTTSSDPTNTANWSTSSGGSSGASVPGTGDDAICDAAGNNTLVMTDDWQLHSLTLIAGYTAKFDCADSGHALTFDDGGDLILQSGTTFDFGTATVSLTNGTFDYEAVTTISYGSASLLSLSGNCNWKAKNAKFLKNVTIQSGAVVLLTVAGGSLTYLSGELIVYGTLTMVGGDDLLISNTASVRLKDGSVVNDSGGSGRFYFAGSDPGNGLVEFHTGATLDVDLTLEAIDPGSIWKPGVYGGLVRLTGAGTFELEAGGDYTFAALTLYSGSSGAVTLANNVHGPSRITVLGELNFTATSTYDVVVNDSGTSVDWVLQGDVVNNLGSNGLNWTRGSGTITFSGAADQNVDFDWQDIEAIEVAKSAGTLTLDQSVSPAAFTGTSGTLDANGKIVAVDGDSDWAAGFVLADLTGVLWYVGGNWSADGQTLTAGSMWYLRVTGTAVASGTGSVQYSNALGYTPITAAGWTEGVANYNWVFTSVVATPNYYWMMVA